MKAEDAVSRLRETLGSRVIHIETPTSKRVFLTVGVENLKDAVKATLNLMREARFMTISAVDTGLDIELLRPETGKLDAEEVSDLALYELGWWR